MEYSTILKANLKQHRWVLLGVSLLMCLTCAALGTVLSIWTNSDTYIRSEIQRSGFGELTTWVSGIPDKSALVGEIESLSEVSRVDTQDIVFANYEANGVESDSEGQLILYRSDENRYRFFTEDLQSYEQSPQEILPGEIYVSPSIVSILGTSIGEEILFPIARSGVNAVFTIAGYYEDPFMGSSMIGMKGFLVCEQDFDLIESTIQESGIDALARTGVMLHIFADQGMNVPASEFIQQINANTSLPQYAEFTHTANVIAGFMLVLQNAFSAMLLAFVVVLLIVVMIVLGHSISSGIESDYLNMGIMKTVGITGSFLRRIQLSQYLLGILIGMLLGIITSFPLSILVSSATLTTTGVRIPVRLPFGWSILSFGIMLVILSVFIMRKTYPIQKIAPMKAIRGETTDRGNSRNVHTRISGYHLNLEIALRQVISGKRRYAAACMVAILLVFFASLVGRMDSWLGSDGKGMMDAFNPADHDLGIQIFGDLTIEETESAIRRFSEITDNYLLAMPNVTLNGMDYTANVISEPNLFHILEGASCFADDEIVLTEFVAADLGVTIGDTLTVSGDTGSGIYTVSGIYSCANDMGDNIGMSQEGYLKIGHDSPQLWCHHYFLEDSSQKGTIREKLETTYGGDIHIHENTWPGLFGIISAMQMLIVLLYGFVTIFILVVTAMTGSRLLASEQRDIGIYKALGFTNNHLRCSFALRFALVAFFGSFIGSALAACLTDPIVSSAMKLAGISNFASRSTIETVLVPVCVVTAMFTFLAFLASRKITKLDVTFLISEI